jgi:hypothetical protein
MPKMDRRTRTERRNDERYSVAVDIEWSAVGNLRPGRLTDVSTSGCFVLSGGSFSDGEIVRICFPLSDGSRIEFLGEIKNHVPDIGFAVRFVSLTDLQKEFIKNFADLHQSEIANK